jgi:O-antigen/teichoic acid export membrane protein
MDLAKIAQNTTYLTIASVFQKVLSFIYFAFLAKALGSEALGQYQAVLSFCGIFVIFMDFGLGPVLTREAAKEEEKLPNYFSKFFGLKLCLIAISMIAMVLTANYLHYLKPANYTQEDLFLIYTGGLIILLDTLVFTFFCVFRALKNLRYEAFNVVIYQGIIFCVGIFGLAYTQSVFFLLVVLMSGSLFSFIYFFILIKKKTKIKLTGEYNLRVFWQLLKIAAPFAIAGIFVKLNGTIDMQMLKYMLPNGNHYVGLYTLAFKLTFALTVLSGAFASAYFPSVSYYLKNDKPKACSSFEKGLVYMALLSMPITAAIFIMGDNLILTVWDIRYKESILPLQIYIASLFFIFANYPVGNFLNAANKQVLNTLNTGIILAVNIVLNLILIPKYNIIGAAIAASISNFLLVLLGLPWVYKILYFDYRKILIKIGQVFFSSAIMALSVYLVKFYLTQLDGKLLLLVFVAVGIISYTLCLFLTRAIRKKDIQLLFQSIKN